MICSSNIEKMLATERPRLVRLCARLSGHWGAAEDLAQETLLRAWRRADRLQETSQVAPWLSGIARNVCLEWSRRHYREEKKLVPSAHADSPGRRDAADQLPNDFDLEFNLEREELIGLLDQALTLLPPETRAVLVQKYVEESPYAEIAARLGLSENAVAVRAHRGKLAFQRILANELRAEAMSFGLLPSEQHTWTETRIWCHKCGSHRLLGRFQKSRQMGKFELRCPTCDDVDIAYGADLSIPFFADLLGQIKTYKPALLRLLSWADKYCRQALASQSVQCLVCGREASTSIGTRNNASSKTRDSYQVHITCRTCHWETNNSLDSFALILPETKQFWRTYPRLCILPTCKIVANNTPAFLTRLRTMTSTAGLDIISLRDTCEIIGVHDVIA
ncbi:RNA polymerase sigma factor [Chloroflexi bacterium TSY]|nr:RNA polymerase sigma factor [Chloroflexi bacterium TSY]